MDGRRAEYGREKERAGTRLLPFSLPDPVRHPMIPTDRPSTEGLQQTRYTFTCIHTPKNAERNDCINLFFGTVFTYSHPKRSISKRCVQSTSSTFDRFPPFSSAFSVVLVLTIDENASKCMGFHKETLQCGQGLITQGCACTCLTLFRTDLVLIPDVLAEVPRDIKGQPLL